MLNYNYVKSHDRLPSVSTSINAKKRSVTSLATMKREIWTIWIIMTRECKTKRSVKREEEEEKCTLLVSRHVECNSLDDHWPLLTKIIILIMWEDFLIDVHVSLGIEKKKSKAKFDLVLLIIYNLQFTLRFLT